MKLAHIKQAVKVRQQKAGGSTTRNNRADYVGAQTRYKRAVQNYKESIIGGVQGVNKQQVNELKRSWLKAGGSVKDFNRLGTLKVREVLKCR